MKELLLHVIYRCKPGMAETFVNAVREQGIQELIRKENGCLQYDYTLSLEEADTIVLLERWTSAEAQEIHMTQPHMVPLTELKNTYVNEVILERY